VAICDDAAMDSAYRVVRLDDVDAGEDYGGLRFKPVRTLLGIEAFGVAAWVADAGEPVIGEHSETDDGHEEMYAVVSGRALFTVDRQEFVAERGTCVSVRPSALRRARAQADETIVLAVGAPTGKPYVAPGWEHGAAAAADDRRGDYARAVEILLAALAEHPGTVGVLYNLACCEALLGCSDDALAHLDAAIAILPRLRGLAQADSDLDSIRHDPRFPASAA
jgi:mannose-6-phosphate isomerase-like protein (cupin superfamily)